MMNKDLQYIRSHKTLTFNLQEHWRHAVRRGQWCWSDATALAGYAVTIITRFNTIQM